MNHSAFNVLTAESTPIARNEKSDYLRRSYGPDSLRKGSMQSTPVLSARSMDRSHFPQPQPRSLLNQLLDSSAKMKQNFNSSYEAPFLMDITDDSNSLLAGDTDPTAYASSLFQEFLDLYLDYSGHHEAFDLLQQYEMICCQKVEELTNIIQKAAPRQPKYYVGNEILENLRDERNTWRLIRTLFQDRFTSQNINEDRMMIDSVKLSDKQIAQNFFLKKSPVRHCQLIIDWLEKNSSDDFTSKYLDRLDYFSDHSIAWENTLYVLKTQRTTFDRPTRDSVITELDPDAPTRQKNNNLLASDKEDEIRMLKSMFLHLRAGNLEEAQKLTENVGQPWLAASLEGWRLYHDPNYATETLNEGDSLLPVEGNKYRDVWKVSCWHLAQEPRISMYQQALYGVLSGNLKAILPACETWDDYLWAYAKVFVDQQTEQEIRAFTQNSRPLENLPPDYLDKVLDFEQIFQELNACAKEDIRREGQGYHQVIQKFLILNNIDSLIETFYSWSHQEPPLSSHMRRIISHIVLFFKSTLQCPKEELCISILEEYVKELIKQKKIPLVSHYTATLPPTYQHVWYAKFLEGITENEERQLCLKYAEDAGLNIPLITKMVVENTRKKDSNPDESISHTVNSAITEEDHQKINSIDWLVFDSNLRPEAMKQANALMRMFIGKDKRDAARLTFAKLPSDSITIVTRQSKLNGQTHLRPQDDNAIREYLCFKAYLEAYDAFSDWFHHFQNAKPKQPQAPNETISFKERVALEHEIKQYELELERWEGAFRAQTKTTTDRLYNVLLFVNGGWMVDQRHDCPLEDGREAQMKMLRKLCIPQVSKLLLNVLKNAELYKESIQLADIIATERYSLYKEFTVQELSQFLSSVRESSLVLLGQGLDPLGYTSEQSNSEVMM